MYHLGIYGRTIHPLGLRRHLLQEVLLQAQVLALVQVLPLARAFARVDWLALQLGARKVLRLVGLKDQLAVHLGL